MNEQEKRSIELEFVLFEDYVQFFHHTKSSTKLECKKIS